MSISFRRSGVAWDGQRWVLAPALVTFATQVEAIRFGGPYPLDGTVASKGHDENNPNSDHTVWPKTGSGVVYAIDVDEEPSFSIDAQWDSLRQSHDPRIKYGIHAGRIFFGQHYAFLGSRTAYTWYPYSGPNAHLGHGHLSCLHDSQYANNTDPWSLIGEDEMVDRNTKADDGNPVLKPTFDKAVAKGVMSAATQPGGVAFNDEFATFLDRAGVLDLKAWQAQVIQRLTALEHQAPSQGLNEAQVKAIINDSQIVAG